MMKRWFLRSLDLQLQLGLLALPLVVSLTFTGRYSSPLNHKEYTAQFLIFYVLALYLLRGIALGRLEWVRSPYNPPILLLCGFALFSIIWSPDKRTTFRDWTLFASFVAVFLVLTWQVKNPRFRDKLLLVMVLSAAAVTLTSFCQYFGWYLDIPKWVFGTDGPIPIIPHTVADSTERTWVFGTIGHNNGVSALLLHGFFALVILWVRSRRRKARIFYGVVAWAMVFVLVVAMTRAVWVAFPITTVVLAFLLFRPVGGYAWRTTLKILAAATGALLIAVASGALIFSLSHSTHANAPEIPSLAERLTHFTPKVLKTNTQARIPAVATLMIEDHPLLGLGFAGFKYRYPEYQGKYFDLYRNSELVPTDRHSDQAHNEYVQVWVELGVAGLFLLFWALGVHFKFCWRALSRPAPLRERVIPAAAFAVSLGWCLINLVAFDFHVITSVVYIFAWLAILVAYGGSRLVSTPMRWWSESKLLPPLSLAAVAVLLVLAEVWPVKLLIADAFYAAGKAFQMQGNDLYLKHQDKAADDLFLNQAIPDLRTSVALQPYNGLVAYELAKTYSKYGEVLFLRRNDIEGAKAYFKRAETVLTDSLKEYQYKGSYYSLGKIYAFLAFCTKDQEESDRLLKQAESNLKMAAYIFPQYEDALHELGRLYYQKGLTTEALDTWRKILVFDPQYPYSHHLEDARQWRKNGKFEAAAMSYEITLQLVPQDVALAQEVYDFYQEHGDKDKALKALEQARQAAPRQLDLWKKVLQAELSGGDAAKAAELVKQASDQGALPTGDVNRLRTLYARLCGQQGRFNELEAVVPDIVATGQTRPTQAAAYRLLGEAYLQVGETEKAQAALLKGLAIIKSEPLLRADLGLSLVPVYLPIWLALQ